MVALSLPGLALASMADDMTAARDAVRARDLPKLARQAERLDDTPLASYPRYWLLSTQLDKVAAAEVSAFFDRFGDSPLADRLRGEWLRELGKRGDWAVFEAELPKFSQIEPESDVNCYQLQLKVNKQDWAGLAAQKSLWFASRGLPDACIPVFDAMFSQGLLNEEDVWKRLRRTLEANNAEFAGKLIARLSQPQGLTSKLVSEVSAGPQKMLPKLATNQRGGRELLIHAISRIARTDPEQAASLLEHFGKSLPAAEMRYAWSRIAYHAARRLHPDALKWFKQADSEFLDDDSLEWRARAALRGNDWAEVIKSIDAMSAKAKADPTWVYWRARGVKAQGNATDANRSFAELAASHHFYGLLAREELGSYVDTAAGRAKVSDDEIKAARKLPGVQRALALYDMNWRLEATREWNWAMRGLDDRRLLAAAEVARAEKLYDRAIYSADRTQNIHDFSLRYLAPYRDVTQAYARQLQLDEAWIYGLIRQESRFISVAKSGVGASGLMQLMPATARWVANKLGIKRYEHATVNEIGTNVQLGTYYLKSILGSLSNQPVLATAGYNAGPGRARAWQAAKPLEGAIYAESIPFNETRDYVKKVMANTVYYDMTFGHPVAPLKRRLGVVPARGAGDVAEPDELP
ncbi:lytic transglycosylase domain-containing protein [Parachitinimonas caeni]|uniref:Transglycosylase SLT domain-containing protein n=1 Tax=Parachitinimonas caeni TaxID=3031301 RepID=A0ABT7DTS0_9NEIS|nr:lytic transglycosylase domain-containing protein [Parachitinimonas caeni]MDK2123204.1 transglycosylase SLT domain-containing protein [Parachitinimonas caeni]